MTITNSILRSPLRFGLLLVSFALICFILSPATRAVVPPPDGGYPGFNTAEGTNALKNLSTGVGNAAVGWYSLFTNSSGSYNTGVGAGTLALNEDDENTAVGAGALLGTWLGVDRLPRSWLLRTLGAVLAVAGAKLLFT